MNRIDEVVKNRRRQKANAPKACLWTVDQGHEVARVPLKKKAGFSAKYNLMTCEFRCGQCIVDRRCK
jgi:hypothetical protein